MAGLLDGYGMDPVAQGLLGMSGALLTPRAMGGGIGAGMQAFNQGAMQAQQMRNEQRRQAEMDAMRREQADMQRKRFGMDEQKFGLELDQYKAGQADAERQRRELAEVGQWIQQNRPELVPAFRLDPKGVAAQLLPQKPKTVTLRPGEQLFQEGNYDTPLASVPDKPPAPPAPSEIEKLIAARNAMPPGSPDRKLIDERIQALNYRQPPASMNVSYGAPIVGVGPDGREMLYQPSNRGGPPIPTGLAPPPKPPKETTEAERTAAAYASRMVAAEATLNRVGDKGVPTVMSEIGAAVPFAGPLVRSEPQQLYRQAQEDWVRAKLRKESGAVIGEDEMAREIKTYFPQPGEPKSVRDQKAAARRQAIAGMQGSAGRADVPVLNAPGASGGWSVKKVP